MFEEVSSKIRAADRSQATKQTDLEREVIELFDHLQDRLSRYLLSLGLSGPDAEVLVICERSLVL